VFDKTLVMVGDVDVVSYLDNLQTEFVIIRVTLPVERQSFRLFPVDTKSVQIVVGQSQPDLQPRYILHKQGCRNGMTKV